MKKTLISQHVFTCMCVCQSAQGKTFGGVTTICYAKLFLFFFLRRLCDTPSLLT